MAPRIISAEVGRACIDAAAEVLGRGEVLALPTDTVYGLAVDAANSDAMFELFVLKRRPAERLVAVLVADMAAAEQLVILSDTARRLAEEFWPGPLTLVAQRRSAGEESVEDRAGEESVEDRRDALEAGMRGDGSTLGVRLPDFGLVRRLAASGPLAVTSANLHGEPTPATARELARLFPSLSLVIDGGCLPGSASTVVDVSGPVPAVLRVGPVTAEQISAIVG